MAIFKVPRQARSRATLSRILETAQSLVGETSIDDLRVVEIARKARCSVGSFYARFPDKEALVLALHRELVEELERCTNKCLAPEHTRGQSLEALLEQYGQCVSETLRRYRGLLRAVEAEIEAGGDARYVERERLLEAKSASGLHKLLADRFPAAASSRLKRLAGLGIASIGSLARHGVSAAASPEETMREASRMFVSYVRAEARDETL